MGLKVQATCFSTTSVNFNENKRRRMQQNFSPENYSLTVS
jgi:hypothetical protein